VHFSDPDDNEEYKECDSESQTKVRISLFKMNQSIHRPCFQLSTIKANLELGWGYRIFNQYCHKLDTWQKEANKRENVMRALPFKNVAVVQPKSDKRKPGEKGKPASVPANVTLSKKLTAQPTKQKRSKKASRNNAGHPQVSSVTSSSTHYLLQC